SDGTVLQNTVHSFRVIGANIFVDDGSFTVHITIVDRGGSQVSATSQFSINAIAPTLTLSGDPVAEAGVGYVLHLSAVEHGTDHLTSVTITWDDGDVQTVRVDSGATDFSVSHTYTNAPNFYSISASFSDEDGTHSASNPLALTVLVPGLDLADIVSETFDL